MPVRTLDLDTVVTLVVLLILSTMVGMALSYPYEARLVPLVVGIPSVVLAGWQLGVQAYRQVRQPPPDRAAIKSPGSTGEPSPSREAAAAGWLLLFTALVLAGGLVAGGAVAVMVSQRIWLRESWRSTVAGGVSAWLALRLFERAFGLSLFDGWIAGWMA